MIYHLTSRDAWSRAGEAGVYTAPSLRSQGFIHLSATPEQTQRVANAIFRGQPGVVVLVIDPDRLTAELRYEAPDAGLPTEHTNGERFPHLYGPLELSAVVRVVAYPCRADGSFDVLATD